MHKKLILFREFKEANDIDIDSITQIEILKDTTIYKKMALSLLKPFSVKNTTLETYGEILKFIDKHTTLNDNHLFSNGLLSVIEAYSKSLNLSFSIEDLKEKAKTSDNSHLKHLANIIISNINPILMD
jgi:hypothetical protein